MRSALIIAIAALLATALDNAAAYEDGAPWGAANPAARDHCASCHWERTPQSQSSQITLRGLPRARAAHTTYALELVFDDPAMQVSGFQVIALTAGEPAGKFAADPQTSAVNVDGQMIRSRSKQMPVGGRVRWRFSWQTNSAAQRPLTLLIAVIASNKDGSAFGDTVHYRRIELAAD